MAEGAPGPVPISAGANGSELEQPAAWRHAMGLQAQCPSLELIVRLKTSFAHPQSILRCRSRFNPQPKRLYNSCDKPLARLNKDLR